MSTRKIFLLAIAFLVIACKVSGQVPQAPATVTIDLQNASDKDSIGFYILNPFTDNQQDSPKRFEKAGRSTDGLYRFSYRLEQPVERLCLILFQKGSVFLKQDKGETLLPVLYLEPGDGLRISIRRKPGAPTFSSYYRKFDFSFSGQGSQKANLQMGIYSLVKDLKVAPYHHIIARQQYFNHFSQKIQAICRYIKDHNNKLSKPASATIMADACYDELDIFSLTRSYYDNTGRDPTIVGQAAFRDSVLRSLDSLRFECIPDVGLLNSVNYLAFTAQLAYTKSYLKNRTTALDSTLYQISLLPPGQLRDKLLVHCLLYLPKGTGSLIDKIGPLSSEIKTDYCIKKLKEIMYKLEGGGFFDATLTDSAGHMASLKGYKGKVIVVDFWFTGCAACTDFYKTVLRNVEEQFSGSDNVLFISISVDKSYELWKRSLRSGTYTSPFVNNFFTGGQGFFHPLLQQLQVSLFPTLVIFDKDGTMVSFANMDFRYSSENLTAFINNLLKEATPT